MDQDNLQAAPTVQPVLETPVQPNFPLAIVGGVGGAVAGAAIWAVVTVVTKMELGIIAVAIGFIVGWAVRELGKGSEQKFAIMAAICGLFGCVLGNALSAIAIFSQTRGVPFMQVVTRMDFAFLTDLMSTFFSPMDLLFYAIAVYEAYKFSLRRPAR
jgi:hypothetical protein